MKTQIIFQVVGPAGEIPISHDFDLVGYQIDTKNQKLLIEVQHDYGEDVVYAFTIFHDKTLYGRSNETQELRLGIAYDNGGNTLEACASHTIELPLAECFSQRVVAALCRDNNQMKVLLIKSLHSAIDSSGVELYSHKVALTDTWKSMIEE